MIPRPGAGVVAAILSLVPAGIGAVEPPLAIDVVRYDATIRPDVESRSLTGSVAITFRPRAAGFAEVSFDAGDLVVERVTEGEASREFQQYTEVSVPWGDRTLRHLGAGVSEERLRQALGGTAVALEFFERMSGVPYRFDTYTQVVSGTGIGQEVNRFAVLPAAILDSPASTLGIHEIAHQWWGNSVTCVDFRHFWLNEGLTTFMTAAFAEHVEGRDAYDRQIAASRARYERVRDAGHDKPLVFPDWNRPTADDRTIVYHKGSYVLSLLRTEIGDEAFWKGIRAYTQRYENASVDTNDFVREMEAASGRRLTPFVRQWIDPAF